MQPANLGTGGESAGFATGSGNFRFFFLFPLDNRKKIRYNITGITLVSYFYGKRDGSTEIQKIEPRQESARAAADPALHLRSADEERRGEPAAAFVAGTRGAVRGVALHGDARTGEAGPRRGAGNETGCRHLSRAGGKDGAIEKTNYRIACRLRRQPLLQ